MPSNALIQSRHAAADQPALPSVSPILFRAFASYSARYLRRHFHAVRLSRAGCAAPCVDGGPLVVYLNHPSWWDPLVCLAIAQRVMPGRRLYAPINADALRQYRFLRRLGLFGVQKATLGGARQFLRTCEAVLAQQGAALWITGQGEFTDPRSRPVRLRPGLGHLASRLSCGTFVPLALEYPFWNERFPEALARFGPPLRAEDFPDSTAGRWTVRLESELERTQDELATEAAQRDTEMFTTVIEGRAGVGGIYDIWRRLRATASGQRFDAEHKG